MVICILSQVLCRGVSLGLSEMATFNAFSHHLPDLQSEGHSYYRLIFSFLLTLQQEYLNGLECPFNRAT